jgi:F-type H+-transporting ATPase subunit epsilon
VLKLTILSPERRLLEKVEVDSVTLPGSEGQIQILPGHVPMVGTLETGVFGFQPSRGGGSTGFVSTGFFEVKDDNVAVMAETLELQGEIDVERARRAQRGAETALREANLDPHAFKKYQLKLQRSIVRQQLVGKDHS